MFIDFPTPEFPVNRVNASTREFDMVLTGQAASLFGTALASIGDVDRDGYQGTVEFVQAIMPMFRAIWESRQSADSQFA